MSKSEACPELSIAIPRIISHHQRMVMFRWSLIAAILLCCSIAYSQSTCGNRWANRILNHSRNRLKF